MATSEARGPEGWQPGVDRALGRGLQPRVDRRLDLQAAAERELRALLAAAELVDHLLLDPRREVRVLACPRAGRSGRAVGIVRACGLVLRRVR